MLTEREVLCTRCVGGFDWIPLWVWVDVTYGIDYGSSAEAASRGKDHVHVVHKRCRAATMVLVLDLCNESDVFSQHVLFGVAFHTSTTFAHHLGRKMATRPWAFDRFTIQITL